MNMTIKRLSLLLIQVAFFTTFIFGQKGTIEVGGFIGFAQYQGDLAENHFELGETLVSKGLFLRFHLNEYLTLKTAYYNGMISGDDKNATDGELLYRNWRFSSKINEFSLLLEWNILGIYRINQWRKFKPGFTPFVFAGMAATSAPAQLIVPQRDAHLVPEIGDKDSFFVLPAGVGLRYDFSQHATIGAEFGLRAVLSDYLDNVSENGATGTNDWYSFAGLNISILFGQWFY